MSLAAQALQIATVAALEEGNVAALVFDSMVEPFKLGQENTVVAVVAVTQGHINFKDRALLSPNSHEVELCIDLAIARKVIRQITTGSDETEQVIEVEFADTGAGHDFVLRTCAYECFRALITGTGTWAQLWQELWLRGSSERPSTWERGVAADKGVRLGVLRYCLNLEIGDDPTPGVALEEGSLWERLLAAMDADAELNDIAKLWRELITSPALPDWRKVQAELGLTFAGIRRSGIGPFEGSEQPAGTGPATPASELRIDDQDRETQLAVKEDESTDDGIVVVEVP